MTLIEPVNLYDCTIDDDSFIGPFVEIQNGVKIGKRCRIQSHVFICSGVTIGDDCFISHGAMFINDKFSGGTRAMGDTTKYKKTILHNKVLIGTNATILPVTISTGIVVGAGAVITKNLIKKGSYVSRGEKFLPFKKSEG